MTRPRPAPDLLDAAVSCLASMGDELGAIRVVESFHHLEAEPYWVGTFHGLGARQLRAQPEIAGLRPGFDIMDADDSRRVVKPVMNAMNLAAGDDTVSISRAPLKLMCNRLSAFKDDLVIPAEAAAYPEGKIANANNAGLPIDPHHLRAAAQVYVEYQHVLRDANAADFGDLLLWPVRFMHGNKEYHARWAGRFDAVLANEYQDVNRAQYSWACLLASEHREIFAVGDDDQSIYGWRGAQIGYIRRFARDFPGAAQVRLEENFRSTGYILAAANAVSAATTAGSARRSTPASPTATASSWSPSATRRRRPSGSSRRSSADTARADAGRTWPSSTATTRYPEAWKMR